MVGKRKKLLRYLEETDKAEYLRITKVLKVRTSSFDRSEEEGGKEVKEIVKKEDKKEGKKVTKKKSAKKKKK